MNIYQILETLKRVEESSAQVGDRVSCPNNITGTIVADAGSSWVIIDDHAETEDDRLEFRKSDCTPIAMAEGQMKHHMWDMAERLSLEKFLDMFPDSEDFYLGVHGVDSREELEQDDQPEKQSESMDDDDGGYVDDPEAHATVNRAGFNKLTPQSYADKIDFVDRQLADPRQQQNWPEFKQRRLELVAAAQRAGIVKEGGKFRFANPKQRPGDQVRGTEKAVSKKGQHPFAGRLVGTDESKLDEKCWDGYQQQGMKKKGDRQVPNCVAVAEEWEDFVNEYGMTTGGTATGAAQKDPKDQAKQVAQVQQGINKLKSAGANIPSGQQAVQSLMKDPTDPASQLDKTIDAGLGQELQDVVTKGDANDVNQLAALIRKVNQQSGA